MNFADAETISAWLLALKGQAGSFRYSPRGSRLSNLTGKTLALPAYSYNDTISVKGWAANQATSLRLGQWMSIGTQLLRIVEAAAFADASGNATITVSPFLRATYPVDTAINFTSPYGVFSLATADGLGYTLTPDRMPEFGTLQAREVV